MNKKIILLTLPLFLFFINTCSSNTDFQEFQWFFAGSSIELEGILVEDNANQFNANIEIEISVNETSTKGRGIFKRGDNNTFRVTYIKLDDYNIYKQKSIEELDITLKFITFSDKKNEEIFIKKGKCSRAGISNLLDLPQAHSLLEKGYVKNSDILRLKITDRYFLGYFPTEIFDYTNLIELHLYGMDNGSPDSFYKLKKLKKLKLYFRKATEFPYPILKLANLESLHIINLYAPIPTEIEKLRKLESLILNYCDLKNIPNSLNNLEELKKLYIVNSKITKYPNSLSKLKKLENLSLSNNYEKIINYTRYPAPPTPTDIWYLKKLKKVQLSTDKRGFPKSNKDIKLDSLEELQIRYYSNGDFPDEKIKREYYEYVIKEYPSFLENLPKIKILNLRWASLDKIPDVIFEMKSVCIGLGISKNITIEEKTNAEKKYKECCVINTYLNLSLYYNK